MPEIDLLSAWHGRLMVLAWVILFPLGILAARFFKVTPWQDWPNEIDNRVWWRTHLIAQYLGGAAVLAALALALSAAADPYRQSLLHRALGWATVALCLLQFLAGWLRGSKGGPTDPNPDGSLFGDHYSMTRRRRVFEALHKSNGYLAVLTAWATLATGLDTARAPFWMGALITFWCALLTALFVTLQRRGARVDTYTAIWGRPYSERE